MLCWIMMMMNWMMMRWVQRGCGGNVANFTCFFELLMLLVLTWKLGVGGRDLLLKWKIFFHNSSLSRRARELFLCKPVEFQFRGLASMFREKAEFSLHSKLASSRKSKLVSFWRGNQIKWNSGQVFYASNSDDCPLNSQMLLSCYI